MGDRMQSPLVWSQPSTTIGHLGQPQHWHPHSSSSSPMPGMPTNGALAYPGTGGSPSGSSLPAHNEREMTREQLFQVLEYFSHLVSQQFPGRQIRLVVHGGACMLLHEGLYRLSIEQHKRVPRDLGMPRRSTTRDVDYIQRSFISEMQSFGVMDAAARLAECVRGTALRFGLGRDWMNSDADVALPFAFDPNGKLFDPIYFASTQNNNIDLHTIFTSSNKMLKLISVTPFWAVALKLVRYTKWDPGDICLLLRHGTVLSHTQWTPPMLKQWLLTNCWAMNYSQYDALKKRQMDDRIEHAVAYLKAWEEAVGGSKANPAESNGVDVGDDKERRRREKKERKERERERDSGYSSGRASIWGGNGKTLSAHDAMGGGDVVGGGESAPDSGWSASVGAWPASATPGSFNLPSRPGQHHLSPPPLPQARPYLFDWPLPPPSGHAAWGAAAAAAAAAASMGMNMTTIQPMRVGSTQPQPGAVAALPGWGSGPDASHLQPQYAGYSQRYGQPDGSPNSGRSTGSGLSDKERRREERRRRRAEGSGGSGGPAPGAFGGSFGASQAQAMGGAAIPNSNHVGEAWSVWGAGAGAEGSTPGSGGSGSAGNRRKSLPKSRNPSPNRGAGSPMGLGITQYGSKRAQGQDQYGGRGRPSSPTRVRSRSRSKSRTETRGFVPPSPDDDVGQQPQATWGMQPAPSKGPFSGWLQPHQEQYRLQQQQEQREREQQQQQWTYLNPNHAPVHPSSRQPSPSPERDSDRNRYKGIYSTDTGAQTAYRPSPQPEQGSRQREKGREKERERHHQHSQSQPYVDAYTSHQSYNMTHELEIGHGFPNSKVHNQRHHRQQQEQQQQAQQHQRTQSHQPWMASTSTSNALAIGPYTGGGHSRTGHHHGHNQPVVPASPKPKKGDKEKEKKRKKEIDRARVSKWSSFWGGGNKQGPEEDSDSEESDGGARNARSARSARSNHHPAERGRERPGWERRRNASTSSESGSGSSGSGDETDESDNTDEDDEANKENSGGRAAGGWNTNWAHSGANASAMASAADREKERMRRRKWEEEQEAKRKRDRDLAEGRPWHNHFTSLNIQDGRGQAEEQRGRSMSRTRGGGGAGSRNGSRNPSVGFSRSPNRRRPPPLDLNVPSAAHGPPVIHASTASDGPGEAAKNAQEQFEQQQRQYQMHVMRTQQLQLSQREMLERAREMSLQQAHAGGGEGSRVPLRANATWAPQQQPPPQQGYYYSGQPQHQQQSSRRQLGHSSTEMFR